jgi:peptidoglycan/LPS O-acetylase OafA/YrhL
VKRLQGIEGVRGLAAGLVLLYHVWLYTRLGGARGPLDALLGHFWVGVTVFFVLSGFLLYRPFVASTLARTATPDLWRYAWSRVVRIVPAYYVALTVFLLLTQRGLLEGPAWEWVKQYLFLQVYSDPPPHQPASTIIVPAWTLCIEVTFYLALPFLALLLDRWARGAETVDRRAGRVLLGLVPLVAIGVGYRVLTLEHGASLPVALPQFLDLFGIGMMLATVEEWVRARGVALSRNRVRVLGLSSAAFVLLAVPVAHRGAIAVPSEGAATALFDLLIGLASVSLLASLVLAREQWLVGRFLSLPALTWLGTFSYAVYLWHYGIVVRLHALLLPAEPRFYLANVAIVSAITLACAFMSWALVEEPALRLKRLGGLGRDWARQAARSGVSDPA